MSALAFSSAALVLPASEAMAQSAGTLTIKGRVLDNNGQPVVGAAVVQKGTTNGTVTDIDGNYVLNAPANSEISVSFIGYDSATEAVGGRSSINFTLAEASTELRALVVVGYGVQKNADLTG